MKNLILVILLLLSFNIEAQKKYQYNKEGLILTGTGIVFSLIAITVPDHSEWTNSKQGQHSYIINKPFYQNPARDVVLGIGVTFTISGLIYHNKKNK